jgi:hypothetical protein
MLLAAWLLQGAAGLLSLTQQSITNDLLPVPARAGVRIQVAATEQIMQLPACRSVHEQVYTPIKSEKEPFPMGKPAS